MGASRKVAAPAIVQRFLRSGKGSTDGGKGTSYQGVRPREPDPPDRLRRQRAGYELFQIARIVHQFDDRAIGQGSAIKSKQALLRQQISREPVLAHGKFVTLW